MPKGIPKKIARDLAKLGEEVIKEGAKQPVKLVEIAAKQIGILPKGWGEEESETQLSIRMVQEKEEERRKKLMMARRRIKELTPKRRQPEPKVSEEEVKRQKELTKEAERKKEVPKVPGKKPRGSALLSLRIKKRRGTGEIRTGL